MPFSSSGDLPHLGIEPSSPALQTDALTSEPPGKQEGEGNVDLLLNGYTASIWDDEKALEMERNDGCTAL